ncbi:hypothetical protein [Rubellimicrobium aerolatum]|uniref:DNA-binding protein n=1 Tax=Rubellimicrobium aerolatum TaxID=490979 RepID=A0ABW0SC95_9RHOB|nr:hypothetical protein [Rubellimicrobium aerolatum]MBP1806303.1 putative DNA-binding transcriptional regulator AlpA [Rubellimicrobium aerolatum]
MGPTIEHLKDLPGWPLLLSDEQAAAYTGRSGGDFRKAVDLWPLPGPRMLAGNVRWSRPEVDRFLDRTPAAVASQPDHGSLVDPVLDAIRAMGAHR